MRFIRNQTPVRRIYQSEAENVDVLEETRSVSVALVHMSVHIWPDLLRLAHQIFHALI